MKEKFRKFIGSLLFMLLVTGFLVHFNKLQVSAATEITDVDISVAPPIEGRRVSFNAYAEEGNGYLVFSDYSNSQGFNSGISWFDITSGSFLQEGDIFVLGHEYRVSVAVKTENKSCYFANKQAGSGYYLTLNPFINGNSATAEKLDDYDLSKYFYIQYTFEICGRAPENISFIEVNGIDRPVAGRKVDFEAVMGAENYQSCYALDEPYINGILWEDLTAGKVLNLNDIYEENHIYRISIPIQPDVSYEFATDEEGKLNVSGNILETTAEIREESFQGYSNNLPVLSYIFDSTSKPLTEIDIDEIGEPVEGQIPEKTCRILAKDFYRTVSENSVVWYENGMPMEEGRAFKKGNFYSLCIRVEAVKGNIFDITSENEPAVKATLNKKDASVQKVDGADPERVLEVYYEFGKCNSPVIDSINILEVLPPIAGRKPDYHILKDGLGYDIYHSKEDGYIDGVCWWDITSGKVMTAEDTFKLNHEYQVRVRLINSIGYEFSYHENGQIKTQVSMNSLPSEVRIVSEPNFGDVLQASHTFLCEGALISSAEITDVVIPRDGEAPAYNVTLKEPYYYKLSNNFGKGGVMWLHSDDTVMKEDEVFELGKTYKLQLMLIPIMDESGNYICRFTTPFSAKVNDDELTADNISALPEIVYLNYKFICGYPKEVLEMEKCFREIGVVNYANFRNKAGLLGNAEKQFEALTAGQQQLFEIADDKSPLKEAYTQYIGAKDFYKAIGLWTTLVEDTVYTGKAIKPSIKVYYGTKLLKLKTDYTISYKNNINVSTKKMATITITGKGDYEGKETIQFKILPARIHLVQAAQVTMAYNGKLRKPVPKLTWNGKNLKNKKDFTVSYPDAVTGAYQSPGTYKILVTGKGNYTGTETVIFNLVQNKLISKATIAKIPAQTYTGDEIRPIPKVKQGGVILTQGVDYKVTYINNKEVGKATAIITGIGNYSGEKRVSFNIKGEAIKKAQFSNYLKSIPYQGEAVVQNCKLTMKKTGKVLKLGRDYKVEYKNNHKAGTATVTFTGINGYTGSVKKQFKILRYNLNKDDLKLVKISTEEVVPAAKGGAKPQVTVTFGDRTLTRGQDYTLSYTDNVSVNSLDINGKKPTVIIKGKGSFQGTIKRNFSMKKQDISLLSMTAEDKLYTGKAGDWKSEPVITDLNNKKLDEGHDYKAETLVYVYGQETWVSDEKTGTKVYRLEGDIVRDTDIVPYGIKLRIIAEGTGNYTGVISCEYSIMQMSLYEAKVTIKDQIYTGKPVYPSKEDIVITLGNKVLKAEDYDIVNYKNNTKKGTASITVKGIGNYGGSITATFKILPKSLKWWWR